MDVQLSSSALCVGFAHHQTLHFRAYSITRFIVITDASQGGLPMYVATRGLYRMTPPTIIVPTVIKESVEKLFDAHRAMDHSELNLNLIGLNVGEEFYLRKDLKVRAFKTYHGIPSQGYIVYSLRQKLKQEYVGLPGTEIRNLKSSGVEITYSVIVPEIAFTGDTTSDFIVDDDNIDVLRAKILIMESTYVSNMETVENARDYGHTHLSEIIGYAHRFQNKAILLIHFSARYKADERKPNSSSTGKLRVNSSLNCKGYPQRYVDVAILSCWASFYTYRRFLMENGIG